MKRVTSTSRRRGIGALAITSRRYQSSSRWTPTSGGEQVSGGFSPSASQPTRGEATASSPDPSVSFKHMLLRAILAKPSTADAGTGAQQGENTMWKMSLAAAAVTASVINPPELQEEEDNRMVTQPVSLDSMSLKLFHQLLTSSSSVSESRSLEVHFAPALDLSSKEGSFAQVREHVQKRLLQAAKELAMAPRSSLPVSYLSSGASSHSAFTESATVRVGLASDLLCSTLRLELYRDRRTSEIAPALDSMFEAFWACLDRVAAESPEDDCRKRHLLSACRSWIAATSQEEQGGGGGGGSLPPFLDHHVSRMITEIEDCVDRSSNNSGSGSGPNSSSCSFHEWTTFALFCCQFGIRSSSLRQHIDAASAATREREKVVRESKEENATLATSLSAVAAAAAVTLAAPRVTIKTDWSYVEKVSIQVIRAGLLFQRRILQWQDQRNRLGGPDSSDGASGQHLSSVSSLTSLKTLANNLSFVEMAEVCKEQDQGFGSQFTSFWKGKQQQASPGLRSDFFIPRRVGVSTGRKSTANGGWDKLSTFCTANLSSIVHQCFKKEQASQNLRAQLSQFQGGNTKRSPLLQTGEPPSSSSPPIFVVPKYYTVEELVHLWYLDAQAATTTAASLQPGEVKERESAEEGGSPRLNAGLGAAVSGMLWAPDRNSLSPIAASLSDTAYCEALFAIVASLQESGGGKASHDLAQLLQSFVLEQLPRRLTGIITSSSPSSGAKQKLQGRPAARAGLLSTLIEVVKMQVRAEREENELRSGGRQVSTAKEENTKRRFELVQSIHDAAVGVLKVQSHGDLGHFPGADSFPTLLHLVRLVVYDCPRFDSVRFDNGHEVESDASFQLLPLLAEGGANSSSRIPMWLTHLIQLVDSFCSETTTELNLARDSATTSLTTRRRAHAATTLVVVLTVCHAGRELVAKTAGGSGRREDPHARIINEALDDITKQCCDVLSRPDHRLTAPGVLGRSSRQQLKALGLEGILKTRA